MPRRYTRRRAPKTRWAGRKYAKAVMPVKLLGKLSRGMIGPAVKQPVQYFKRSFWNPAGIVATANQINYSALTFRLNQLPDFTDFTNLYDQYKICAVKVEIIPQFDTNTQIGVGTVPTASHIMSQNFHIIDYDDAVVPTDINQLMQHQNLKRTPCNRVIKRFLKPKFADRIFSNGIIDGFRPSKGFIDVQSPGVEHYGLKIAFASNPLTLTYGIRTTYYVACKNVR